MSNGQTTARRVEEAIRLSCSTMGAFFAVARDSRCARVPPPFNMVEELKSFGAFVSGKPVPEGYEIPECVLSLADKMLASKSPDKQFMILRSSVSSLRSRELTRLSSPAA